MKTAAYTPLSESEHLAFEAQSPVRNEHIAGEIFAMAGASGVEPPSTNKS